MQVPAKISPALKILAVVFALPTWTRGRTSRFELSRPRGSVARCQQMPSDLVAGPRRPLVEGDGGVYLSVGAQSHGAETHRAPMPMLTLVQRVVRIGLKKEVLQPDHDRVEIQDGLPVLSQDIEAHIPVVVEIGVVDLKREAWASRVSRG